MVNLKSPIDLLFNILMSDQWVIVEMYYGSSMQHYCRPGRQTDTDRHQSVRQELLSGWCSPVG